MMLHGTDVIHPASVVGGTSQDTPLPFPRLLFEGNVEEWRVRCLTSVKPRGHRRKAEKSRLIRKEKIQGTRWKSVARSAYIFVDTHAPVSDLAKVGNLPRDLSWSLPYAPRIECSEVGAPESERDRDTAACPSFTENSTYRTRSGAWLPSDARHPPF
jgi:hypothetical protein